jgi:hypothetical protein
METTDTREQWLNRATDALRPLFKSHSYDVPVNVKTTCGFPSRGALSLRKRTIGQCWDSAASSGKVFEIFISPVLADQVEVLAVLAHELVHATVGTKCGHKKPFKQCATAIGLEGKMTSTTAGESFKRFAAQTFKTIGAYPHAQLNPLSLGRKQSTRLIKCECDECGYTVRTTRSWIETAGTPICPLDNKPMEAK